MEAEDMVNATLVAGSKLRANDEPFPYELPSRVAAHVGDMNGLGFRPARSGAVIDTDDHSSLEMVDANLRLRWRENLREALPPALLID
jgi:hypothetical protein